MENKKKKKFKLFDMNRDGKGVEKVEEGPKNFVNFFKTVHLLEYYTFCLRIDYITKSCKNQ